MLLNPLANFKIQKYCKSAPKFNGVYSRNNLCKIMDGPYIINFVEYCSIGTHWIALYVKTVTYFVVDHISKEIRKFIRNKNIITNIYRVQAYHSIMCGYF